MGFQTKILAQITPGTDTETFLYSPPAGKKAIIKNFVAQETQSVANKFSLFVDQDGSAHTTNEALYYDTDLAAGRAFELADQSPVMIPLNDVNGSVYVRSDTAGNITYTLYGIEYYDGDIDLEVWDKTGGVFKPRYFELEQVRPAGGALVPFNISGAAGSSPIVAGEDIVMTDIFITNVTGGNGYFLKYHDADGEVFNLNSSAGYGDIIKNSTVHLSNQNIGLTTDDAFAVASSINAGLNFTIYAKRQPLRSV